MTDSPAARPIFVTREQRALMENLSFVWGGDIKALFDSFCRAWDAAPADATEAVANSVLIWPKTPEAANAVARAVLAALGAPTP